MYDEKENCNDIHGEKGENCIIFTVKKDKIARIYKVIKENILWFHGENGDWQPSNLPGIYKLCFVMNYELLPRLGFGAYFTPSHLPENIMKPLKTFFP